MNIIICGAGEVGSHTAEVLASAGTNITIIDTDADRLRAIADKLDVATLCGNCAQADVLAGAGAKDAALVVAATNRDEINLLAASLAAGVGAARTIARVHHSAFFAERGFKYREYLKIDRLICPEFSTAHAIARKLRNPGAVAVEGFARGTIEMQEFPVSRSATAIGKSLRDLSLPAGSRLAAVTREGGAFIPDATTTIEQGDIVILVGNADVFQAARKIFHDEKARRRHVVIMGGPPMAVWLCRALEDRDFSIRLFETDRDRAEELAGKLGWVTVLHADPTDQGIFDDEHLENSDAFVALLDDDEQNILGCAWAKSMGIEFTAAVVQRSSYMRLLSHVGIDSAFSPRQVAASEIELIIDESSLRLVSNLAEGIIDVYRVRVGPGAEVVGKPLREVKLSPNWIIAAIQVAGSDTVSVPGAEDVVNAGDTLLVIGRHGRERTLRKMFDTG